MPLTNLQIVKISKKRIDKEYSKFAGILIDIFYDHLLAKNWAIYSDTILANFTAEIHESFQKYSGEIPPSAREIIGYMVDGDWLTSYQNLSGVENSLDRIDDRIRARMGDRIKLVDAMPILERESITYGRLRQRSRTRFSFLLSRTTATYSRLKDKSIKRR
jgi:acyl carrier protein phosphodiesterase